MGKPTSEMTEEQILRQRERANKNYFLSKEEKQVIEYTAISERINRLKISGTHKAYLKLGALLELEPLD